jgi:hypothetical protein
MKAEMRWQHPCINLTNHPVAKLTNLAVPPAASECGCAALYSTTTAKLTNHLNPAYNPKASQQASREVLGIVPTATAMHSTLYY